MSGEGVAVVLTGWADPEAVFLAVNDGVEDVIWLDAGIDATAGRSIIGVPDDRSPRLFARSETLTEIQPAGTSAAPFVESPIFDVMRAFGHSCDDSMFPAWMGWFGHELGMRLLGIAAPDVKTSLASFVLVERALVFDHALGTVTVFAPQADSAWLESTVSTVAIVRDSGLEPKMEVVPDCGFIARSRHDDAEYLANVRRCMAFIAEGEVFQICLTNDWTLPRPANSLAAYRRLRRIAPSHHGGYLRIGGEELLSSSPERFVEVGTNRIVSSRPMKGTRPRGTSPEADAALHDDLRTDRKELAENVMIVDLVRNDLSRVCDSGTVAVTELFAVESYRTVHQLVSTVEGRLSTNTDALDAFRALFPPGSMTGAPKHRATRLLADLERGGRGAYAGAFGYFGADGGADLATTIRSIHLHGDTASFGTGGGITIDSDPASELAEMHLKARALLAALGATAMHSSDLTSEASSTRNTR